MENWEGKGDNLMGLTKIRLYNSVNLKYGYLLLEIRSPREVLYER